MTKQDFGPFGVMDIASPDDVKDAMMGHNFSDYLRERYRGEKLLKLPITRQSAASAAFTLAQNPNGGAPVGPEQGYLWRIHHVLVSSNVLADTASYVLYASSDVTDTSQIRLLDAIAVSRVSGTSVSAQGTVTDPGALATIAVTSGQPAGLYQVTATANVDGTVTTADDYNMTLSWSGGPVITIPYTDTESGTVTAYANIPAGGTFFVKTIAAASGVSAIYHAELTATALLNSVGENVNVAYNPGNRTSWLWPGEQLYAGISGATAGNTYAMTGIVSEVPMEMQGKFL